MNIEDEAGCFHSFCPLASIGWLHRKIKNSFFLIVGTRVCASFIQNAFGMMLFAKPRFATAVMEESDIYQGPSLKSLREIIKEIASAFPLEVLFLWGTCPVEILKIDLEKWAHELQRDLGFKVIPVPVSGLDISFTDGEDVLLTSLIDLSAKAPTEENLVLIGSLAAPVETELALALGKIPCHVRFFPSTSIY